MNQERHESLIAAIRSGDADRVERLLEEDPALADERDSAGISPLLLALYHGRRDIARMLRSRTSELGAAEAAAVGDVDRLRRLLRQDDSVVATRTADGFTPLHLAAFFAHPAAARVLLAAGADVDAQATNPSGVRPLHSAAASRSAAAVRVVLAAGADVDAQQTGGYTALHSAAKHGDVPMVRVLLAHGADPSIAAADGQTALAFAEESGAPPETVRRLVRLLSAG